MFNLYMLAASDQCHTALSCLPYVPQIGLFHVSAVNIVLVKRNRLFAQHALLKHSLFAVGTAIQLDLPTDRGCMLSTLLQGSMQCNTQAKPLGHSTPA